jgi:hypothetical protein
MGKILKAVPVLPALVISDTVHIYFEKLGFGIIYQENVYGIIKRDDVDIHFWHCEDNNIA